MIFTSESGLTDPSRIAAWDSWYLGHLAAMAAVPGISSAQRFRAVDPGPPPSLAMYSVASPAVFDTEVYRQTRGMGPFVPVVDESQHRRNLFAGLDAAPEVPMGGVLLVVDRALPAPQHEGLVWLRAVALDRSTPYRAIGVFDDIAAAGAVANALGGAVALYRPITERFVAARGA
ncbi:MAG: hypothetical protein ACM3JG_15230 [Thiohalocapsa sp.]